MSDNFVLVLTIAAFATLTMLIGFSTGHREASRAYKSGAIERGYAQYCPADGDWAWVGECGK
jgi:hypothetical protein